MKDIVLINVLPKNISADCRIKSSLTVPLTELSEFANQLPKDQLIVVYCAHYKCDASRRAWKLLHDMGFTNVKAYEGGMVEWLRKGYPVEGACREDYLKKEITERPHSNTEEITIDQLKDLLGF